MHRRLRPSQGNLPLPVIGSACQEGAARPQAMVHTWVSGASAGKSWRKSSPLTLGLLPGVLEALLCTAKAAPRLTLSMPETSQDLAKGPRIRHLLQSLRACPPAGTAQVSILGGVSLHSPGMEHGGFLLGRCAQGAWRKQGRLAANSGRACANLYLGQLEPPTLRLRTTSSSWSMKCSCFWAQARPWAGKGTCTH